MASPQKLLAREDPGQPATAPEGDRALEPEPMVPRDHFIPDHSLKVARQFLSAGRIETPDQRRNRRANNGQRGPFPGTPKPRLAAHSPGRRAPCNVDAT